MNLFRQLIVYTMVTLMNLVVLSSSAQATLIGVDAMVAAQSRQDAEQKIRSVLSRGEVSAGLQRLGVHPNDVESRVAALTDNEVNSLARELDNAPAGGDFFGTVGVIFVILLITDILGFTKIFPFTRAQR